MKKVISNSLESLAHYKLVDAPEPTPGPRDVVIQVAACGVGYVDALVALGGYQVKPLLPHTPGQEIAGWIKSLGEEVDGLDQGDRVLAEVAGGFAELVQVPASAVTKIPAEMTFAQAAAFRINYITALHGLRDRARLQAGERLLVLGAAGGVGLAAIQVGKRLGATVVAAASTEAKRQFALANGADTVVETTVEGFRDRLKACLGRKGPDIIFDPVSGPLFELAFRSLAWGGRHLVIGFTGGRIPALPANLPLLKGASLTGVDVRQFLQYEPEHATSELAELLSWVEERSLVPPTGRTFEFEAFAPALEYALSGAGPGKTILSIEERRA